MLPDTGRKTLLYLKKRNFLTLYHVGKLVYWWHYLSQHGIFFHIVYYYHISLGGLKKMANNEGLNIGRIAPDFTAMTTQGIITLSQYTGKWVMLFSHPGDFTPVCTSEFISFAQLAPEFEKRGIQLLGISIDSNPSHLAWVYNIYQFTGITIPFPIIADRNAEISALYGMVNPDRIYEQSVRDVFFIDPTRKIRAILTYPATNGRNSYELLRLFDALQTTDEFGVSTPANWLPGQPVILPVPYTYEGLLERVNAPAEPGVECLQWYLCYKDYDELTPIPPREDSLLPPAQAVPLPDVPRLQPPTQQTPMQQTPMR